MFCSDNIKIYEWKSQFNRKLSKVLCQKKQKISQYPKQIFHLIAEKGFWKDNNLNILEKV